MKGGFAIIDLVVAGIIIRGPRHYVDTMCGISLEA